MDISRMSYCAPHERVFVINKRRSSSVTTLKPNANIEYNKNFVEPNYRQNNIHSFKHDSNYLLGSSIVNVNFVNNVANLNRGFDAYRNFQLLNSPVYQRSNLEGISPNRTFTNDNLHNDTSNQIPNDAVYPFENYSYKSIGDTRQVVSKKNLNIDDKIITNRSYQTSTSGGVCENRENSLPVLTRNYLNNSSCDEDHKIKKEHKNESKSNDKMCVLNTIPDLKRVERKNKLTQYIDKLKNDANKIENSQKRVKITIGKPTHEFVAKYPDPVEKELENWHNSHNSTLKWERVKHGLYSVDGSIVHLLKLNGSLYVEGHGFKKHKGKMTILKFVEEKESRLKEKG